LVLWEAKAAACFFLALASPLLASMFEHGRSS
jgi:hypothetical protein